jgi:hypothetical protein
MESGHYTTISGRRFCDKQIQLVRETVQTFQNLSRKELALTLCEHLNWVTPKGGLKINSCLAALDKFEQMGLVKLPPKKVLTRRTSSPTLFTESTRALELLEEPLANLGAIELRRVTTKADRDLWQEYVDRYHYLGYKRPFGAHIRYFIISKAKNEQVLGCLLFAAAAWSLAPRDLWIGWGRKDRVRRLNLILNNSRFLILPWIKVEHLASKVLAIAAKTVPADWQEVYGYKPVMFETFVDTTKYEGTCYQAANWHLLGTTQGRGRMDRFSKQDLSVKKIYAYPLTSHFRDVLRGQIKRKSAIKTPTLLEVDASIQPLWAKVVSALTEICSDFDREWRQRRRVIDTLMLVVIIFRLVLSKNTQSYATTIADMWKSRRDLQLILPQPKPIAASALTAARQKLDEDLFKVINKKLVEIYATEATNFSWLGHRLFAVDGSKLNLPRPLSQCGYSTPTTGHYPQGLVSTLYQLKSRLPFDFDLVKHANERKCASTHLGVLNQGDVIVYDRGYFSYSLLYQHLQRGVLPIFRLQKESFKEIEEFIQSSNTDKLVSIMPRCKKTRKSLLDKFGIKELEPLPIRLVKYCHGSTEYYLGTTLLDSEKYSVEELADVYHARWGIEELYKISKSLIAIEDFHSRSDRGVKQELYAHFTLISLSRFLSNQAEGDINNFTRSKENKQEVAQFDPQIKVNFKNCLAVVNRYLDAFVTAASSKLNNLVHAMLAEVRTCKQKFRPNRSYERKSMKPVGKWKQSGRSRKDLMNVMPATT